MQTLTAGTSQLRTAVATGWDDRLVTGVLDSPEIQLFRQVGLVNASDRSAAVFFYVR